MRELIYGVVEAFYKKAVNDVLIGYHFTKFGQPHILEEHLQRITSFWEMQLTGSTSVPLEGSFHFALYPPSIKDKTRRAGPLDYAF